MGRTHPGTSTGRPPDVEFNKDLQHNRICVNNRFQISLEIAQVEKVTFERQAQSRYPANTDLDTKFKSKLDKLLHLLHSGSKRIT